MSSTGEWMSWLSLVGAVAVLGGLVYLAWWGLFADRARGRRRCPRCWYDMAHSPGMTCPECGFVAQRETQFARTRRNYVVAAGAVAASVAVTLWMNHHISQRGWTALMPTRLLLWTLPLSSSSNSEVMQELASRATSRQLSSSQWESLVGRCAGGDWFSRPVSESWESKYGSFITIWRRRIMNNASLEELLLTIPPRIDVATRETWPEEVPIVVKVQVMDWWPAGTECRVRATPHVTSTSAASGPKTTIFCRSGDDQSFRPPFTLQLPPLDPSATDIKIDFQIDRRSSGSDSSGGDSKWVPVSTQTISVSTRIQGRIDQLSQPVNSVEMTAAMQEVFSRGVVKWSSGHSPVRFNINTPATLGNEFNDTAIGICVELLCDDLVARRLNLWWIAGNGTTNIENRGYGLAVDHEDLKLLANANAEDNRWKLRVRSDPRLALRAGDAPKYWSGEFTMPLTLRTADEEAPPRSWWIEED